MISSNSSSFPVHNKFDFQCTLYKQNFERSFKRYNHITRVLIDLVMCMKTIFIFLLFRKTDLQHDVE